MGLWSRFGRLFRSGRHEAEIREEIEFHLSLDAAKRHDEREARLRFGNRTRIAEETRAMGIVEWLDSLLCDARFAHRQLRKSPWLTLTLVSSLAIGVGANTAIFSLVDAALLQPLPVKAPDALRVLEWTSGGFPEGVRNINGEFGPIGGGQFRGSSVSASTYRRLAREQTGFESLIGFADAGLDAIAVGAQPAEQVQVQYVSSNFFTGLGVAPVVGRTFAPDEDRVGAEPVVVVSYRYWMGRFGGRRDVTERRVRINNAPAQIIGVAPEGFFGPEPGQWTDIYAPLAARVVFNPNRPDGGPRGEDDRDWWVRMMARLKPGVPEAMAEARTAALFRNLAVPPNAKPEKTPKLIALPGRRGAGGPDAKSRAPLWIILLLAGVLLLMVCANVANLLLARSVARQRESAVRLALGAARGRLFRQYLVESAVLALMGGVAGVVLGRVLARTIPFLLQSGPDTGNVFDLRMNGAILAYSAGISLLTVFLFGLAPAMRGARADIHDALKTQMGSMARGRLTLPRVLVSLEVALCLIALMAAGLAGHSLKNLKDVNPGFVVENLAYATVNPWQAGYSAERVGPYIARVREELARLPGVRSVSFVEVRLLSGSGNGSVVRIPGRTSGEKELATVNRVGDGAIETLRIPLLAGRTIEARDLSAKSSVVVVNRLFAEHFFPNQNPLGQRIGFWNPGNDGYEIVGVVGNSLYNTVRSDPAPAIYAPFIPEELKGHAIHFVIRAAIDSGVLAAEVRRAVAAADTAVPLAEFHTQTALIDRLLRMERLLAFLSAAFGAIALTLAAIGIGGLLAYAVARRTNEIGIRMAIGASAGEVTRMVLRDALKMAGAGILIGLPGAYAIGKILKSVLFHLKPIDATTAIGSFLALAAIALLAAWIPARRAAGISPMAALREE